MLISLISILHLPLLLLLQLILTALKNNTKSAFGSPLRKKGRKNFNPLTFLPQKQQIFIRYTSILKSSEEEIERKGTK